VAVSDGYYRGQFTTAVFELGHRLPPSYTATGLHDLRAADPYDQQLQGRVQKQAYRFYESRDIFAVL
jgi:hypothetical protein